MKSKFSDIFFGKLNNKEKEIWSSTLFRSGILCALLLIGSSILQISTKLFDGYKGWDMALISIVFGYAYFVIRVACKGVLYTERNINKNKLSTCVGLSLVSLLLIPVNCIYWKLDAFLYDPQRLQFGIIIFAGSLVMVVYTFSTWISLIKLKQQIGRCR